MLNILGKPHNLALFFGALVIFSLLVVSKKQAETLWITTGILFGVYILASSLIILFTDTGWDYFFSVLGFSFLLLVFTGVFIQVLIHLLKIEGSSEGAMVFLIIIFHPVFLLVTKFIKWLFSGLNS